MDATRYDWANSIRSLHLECTRFGEKGWSPRILKILRLANSLQSLELRMIDDLRAKVLTGPQSEHNLPAGSASSSMLADFHTLICSDLKRLHISGTTFRAHTHPNPASLTPFLQNLSELTLFNLGLPAPATHLTAMLEACHVTLVNFTMSSLRDVGFGLFSEALQILARMKNLQQISFGTLTSQQMDALSAPISKTSIRSIKGPEHTLLGHLTISRLTFTLPHISLGILLSLPDTLTHLTIRPPARRQYPIPIEELEEESQIRTHLEQALRAGAGKNLQVVRWEGTRGAQVRERLERALQAVKRDDQIQVQIIRGS